MSAAFRRRLLGTTLTVEMHPPPTLNTSMAPSKPPPTGAEIMDACKRLLAEPRPRWVGRGSIMTIEVDQAMPDGWFGLRQPDQAMAYAGPLPIPSFGVFYRGGDVVRLSPRNAEQFARRMKEQGGGSAA